MKKLYFLLFSLSISVFSFGQVLEENFDYGMTNGDLTAVSSGTWAQHSGSAGPVQYVATPSLTMTGYPSSGIGGHVAFSGTSQDVNRSFSGISSGTVYGSALVNLSAVGSGNYFMHFNISGGFTTRVFAQDDGSGNVLFGIATSGSTATYGTTTYSLNTTYLLVFSYDIATGVSNLHVLSAVTPTEPMTPEATDTGTTGRSISAIAFRQSTGIPSVLIDGVRIATSWNEIMNNSTVPSLNIVTPTNNTEFNPGTTSVDVTFTTQNIDLMVSGNQVNTTVDTNPTDTDVSSPYTIPTMDGNTYNVTFELLENNIVVDTKMVSFSVANITQVSDIASLRAGTQGNFYELTSEALLTYQQSFRNQKFFEDATGAILIDDDSGTITTNYNIGDGITGIVGELSEFGGLLQFTPSQDTGAASSTGNTLIPQTVTLTDLNTNPEDYESELITVTDVVMDNTTNSTFVTGTEYQIEDQVTATFNFRTSFFSADYIGANVPTVPTDITGIITERSGNNYFITARDAADFSIAILSNNDFDRVTFSLYPNPASNGKVTISSNNSLPIDVTVYDILGKEVKSSTIIDNNLSVVGLKSGIYVLRLTQNGAATTKKLIIE